MLISELSFWEKNPRKISKENLDKLKRSIQEDPEFLVLRKILVNQTKDKKTVYAGNQRLRGLIELGYDEIPDDWVNIEKNLPKRLMEKRAFKDNVEYGTWDTDILDRDFDTDFLKDLDLPDGELPMLSESMGGGGSTGISLAERFIIPPFSIRDTKQGYWMDRKRQRKEKIKDNGESRENTLMDEKASNRLNEINGSPGFGGVSILDPVMAECINRFFCIEKGVTFDPFAGDSVFGYVSGYTGHKFLGIELRKEQADLNQKRCDEDGLDCKYFNDTSENMDEYIQDNSVDMLFSCPPYWNLEKYSDSADDLSNKTKDEFFKTIKTILQSTYKKLKDDSFATIVIGEVRDKDGEYINFVGEIISIMIGAGYKYYNEIILATPIGTTAIRAGRQFNGGRKIGKIHQNILVFYKGNMKNIKAKFGELDFSSVDFNGLQTKEDESTDI